MASILKVDKIRGTGLDSDTMSFDTSGNITIPKNVTFSGTVSGDNVGAIVKLATFNITNVAEFIVNSTYINSTYDTYKFVYDLIAAGETATLYNQAVVGGTVDTGSNYGFECFPLDGGSTRVSDSTNVMCVHNKYNIGNGAGEGISGEFTLFNVNSTTRAACISGHSTSFTTDPVPTHQVFGGAYKSTQRAKVLNGLKFFFDDGTHNIASGFITIYGVVK